MPKSEANISFEELEELTRDANKYVKTVKEPREQEENEKRVSEFTETIGTERELLKIFSNNRLELEVVYDKKLFKFKIKPLTDTKDIEAIGLDFKVYMDLDDLEKEIILKKNRGEVLTSKEQDLYVAKEEDFAKTMLGNGLDQAHHILANFLSPPSFNRIPDARKRYEKKLGFWKNFPLDLKMFLFSEVIDRLGINPGVELKLFQTN